MKKKQIALFQRRRMGHKLILKMKLTFIILIGCLMQVSATVYSQATKFSFNIQNKQVVDVLKEIEDKSDFRFFYQREQVDVTRKVDLTVTNRSVEAILGELFKDQGISFSVIQNNLIIITPDVEKSNSNDLNKQQKSISGKVTDSNGSPLPGVTVIVRGSTSGTITDSNGNFSMSTVPADATLSFSFIGLKTQEIAVGGKTILNVKMVEENIGIDEVVAVGYGTQKKENLTGSIASVKSTELIKTPVASTSNSLAGRLPGLVSLQSSGRPGADAASLSIRGFGNALFIVDGVETDFNSIDANQIESVSILKDGSASIYGSRAGNGVILVTTKRGIDTKPTITLNSSSTLQGITIMPKPVNAGQYAEMKSEAWLQSGKPEAQVPYTPEQIKKYYDGSDPLYPSTNWYNEVIRDWAPQQNHNLSIRGGSDKIKYYGFLGYLDQGSMWKKNGGDYKRYNFQSNIDAKILDNLSLQLTIASTVEDRNFPARPQSTGTGGVWSDLWFSLPIYSSSFPDPTKIPYAGGGTGGVHISSNSAIVGYDNTDNQNINGTMMLNYNFNFVKGLSAKLFVNSIQFYNSEKNFQKPVTFYTYNPSNEVYTLAGVYGERAQLLQGSGRGRTLTGQFSLNYDNTFGVNHHVSAFALYEVIDYKNEWISASRTNFLTPAIEQLFGGSTTGMSNNGAASEMGRASYVGRINYSYKNRYLFESSFRADASAKFPTDKRWGYFPSVSLGWRLSEEEFMKSLGSIDNLKLRASYGSSGNDGVGNFQYLSGYGFNPLGAYGTYILGAGAQTGLQSTGLANPYLTWEKIKIYNIGLDFSLFKRKLYGETDVFYRERNGIPSTRITTLPSSFGSELPPENINSLTDRGFELMLGTSGNSGDFQWDLSGNISWSRSKWDHFEEPVYEDPDQIRIYKNSGRWTDRQYGYVSDGLFKSQAEIDALTFDQDNQGNVSLRPGDVRFKDMNKDGIFNWKDMVEIGKGTVPHWMLGFNTNLKYKNFDLSALFQGALGYYNYVLLDQGEPVPSTVMYDLRWTQENNDPNALLPRLGGASTNGYGSDYYYRKAGYVRLKVLTIGYNVPKSLLKKISLSELRFYFAGTNLLTFDKLKKYDLDPESPSASAGRYYPQQKTITLGINLSF